MGTAARFNEEARAARIALALAAEGFGVLWEPDKPHVVMTAANRAELREVSKKHPGTMSEWWKLSKIDKSSSEERLAARAGS